ncbi:unnamed protein product [Arctia plantaginis]|uniref:Regulatory protein zeste n=2 Tax=Arctia plantaginis TaxID=874455 RepID=A0A8S1B5D0_ARCPL|nr:unnamed protein product [Arctia plantaginis]
MKTSSSQFELMVTFMEQHGDLSKLLSNARGRVSNFQKWEELTRLLNSDGSGCTKTTEKWKKVWSDYKNNTKKKAARLHRSANATGGGPAMFSKLSDFEQRVLKITGVQAATGLAVEEAGLPQVINTHLDSVEDIVSTPQPHQFLEVPIVPASPQLTRAISSPPHTFVEEEVQTSQYLHQPEQSASGQTLPESRPATTSHLSYVEVHVEGHGTISPSRPTSPIHVVEPAPAMTGETTPRRMRVRNRTSPRRRVRPSHTEQATQHFLQAEAFWQQFKAQQHQDYMELRREQNRIRIMEVETQRRALDILDKFVNKYCKE